MKNNRKSLVFIIMLILSTVIVSCDYSSKDKVENAKENVFKANKNLDEANEKYLEEVEKYKTETTTRTDANKKSIAEFNQRITKEKKEVKAQYEAKIIELDEKNTDLKKKMDGYKSKGQENWESFKTEFNHDMNELGDAINDLLIDNE